MRLMIAILAVAAGFGARPLAGQQVEGSGSGAVAGVVVAEGTGAPLPGAVVTVRRAADSTVVGTSVVGSGGRFARSGLPDGEYVIEVSTLGHEAAVRSGVRLSGANRAADLGTIALRPVAIALEGVTVAAERSAVALAPDRSIYNVRDMPIVRGGSATDALRAIPELEVDIDDNVRARGGEPQIYLDGRPLPMQGSARTDFLRSLRADRIDRVEYISNPSARFEADGQSGIVNIVLRRDVSLGLSGSVSTNAGTRGTQGASTRLNYQAGRLTLFGGGTLSLSQSNTNTFDVRQNLASASAGFLEQNADRRRDGLSGGADVTAELRLSDRSTVWGIVRGNAGSSEEDAVSRFTYLDQGRAVTDRYERVNFADQENDGVSTALGYRRVVQAQRDELSAEIRYNGNGSDSGNRNLHYAQNAVGDRLDGDPGLTRIASSSGESLWSGQVDLSKPLGEATRIDVGYRVNLRGNDNWQEGEAYVPATSGSSVFDDRFRYDEDSHAGYVTLDRRFGRLSMQGGLRMERVEGTLRSNVLESPIETRHTGVFPSANLAYDAGGGRQLRFSYTNRVQRPNASNYNPINTTPTDPLNITVGNPLLTLAEIHQFEITGSWTGALGTLRVANYYFRGTNLWDRVRSVDGNGISTVKPMNVASAGADGVNINASLRQLGRFSGNAGFNLQHLAYDVGDLTDVRSAEFTSWNLNASITTTVTPTLRIQTMGRYSPGEMMPYGRTSAMRQLNLGVTQRIYGDRGTINLAVVDPFDLSRSTITSENAAYQQTGRTSNRIRRATLTVSYNFGRAPQSNRRVVADEQSSGGGMSGQ